MKTWSSAIALTHMTALLAVAQPPAEKQFGQLCGGCHGDGATGGDRAPALVNNRALRSRSETEIEDVIKNGTPGGMPAFALAAGELKSLATWVRSLNTSAFDAFAGDAKPAGDAAAGEKLFFGSAQCATCHMVHGRGKVNGPDLSDIGRK